MESWKGVGLELMQKDEDRRVQRVGAELEQHWGRCVVKRRVVMLEHED